VDSTAFPISKRIAYLGVTAGSLIAVIVAALMLAPVVRAQVPPSGGHGSRDAVQEANATFSCGESKRLVVRTWESNFSTNSLDPVNVPNAGLNMTVPPGTDCIIVRFNAFVTIDSFEVRCVLRALMNGVSMSPSGSSARGRLAGQAFVSEHSWAQPVTNAVQTTYFIQVQVWRPANGGPFDRCHVDDWKLEVERRD
jgi:hypothetical protein